MTKYVHILLWVPLLYGVLFFILWVQVTPMMRRVLLF